MKAVVLKIDKRPSKMGGSFYYVFVKSLDQDNFGKSFRACVSDEFRNFNRWLGVKVGNVLELLNVVRSRKGEVIDADSPFSVTGNDPVVKQTRPDGEVK